MLPRTTPAVILALATLTSQAQVASTCQSVYADSVRNVDIQSRVITEQNDLFSRHCETNGSLKRSSTAIDLTAPMKAIDIGFSGGQTEARQKMQEFCKTHSERLSRFDAFYQLNNRVVVDALQSFNQCIALEGKRVQISHVATDSRQLVVRVGFNPAEQNVTLNSVQYDTTVATCRSNINGDGTPMIVNSTSGQITARAPFSVACERTAITSAGADKKFPRLELLVDTNQGAYSVAMPTEEMLGYDLANANRQAILAATQEQARLRAQIDSLSAKIAGAKATAHTVTQGRGAGVACPQHGGNLEAHVKNTCRGGRVSELTQIGSRSGSTCGYTTYKWSCITFP